jgi:hypothetical protein
MTKQLLYKLYHIKKLSTYKIAKVYKVSAECIYYRLKKFNITLRHLKGNHSWNFIGGRKRFPKCKDCNKRLTRMDALRCKKCDLFFRIGINGRNYKGLKISKCQDCGIELSRNTVKRCRKCNVAFWKFNPHKHPAYINGKSKEPYAFEFTKELKESIRKRDNYICKLCNKKIINNTKKYFLAIHHIDYNKKNCKESNLISLCGGCNSKVNTDRKYWIKYFKKLIKKIIRRN